MGASACREPKRELMLTWVIEILVTAGFLALLFFGDICGRGLQNAT